MEFHEKLQQLRKQNNWTQEQLAERLFVSRTAVSKWESGKGYPSIDSLKAISQLFSVTIDDLLSGEELMTLAQSENRSNLKAVYQLVYSIIDLLTIAFVFLPLYGQLDGDYIRSVTLLAFRDTPSFILMTYWSFLLAIFLMGILQLWMQLCSKERWRDFCMKASFGLDMFGVCFFAATQEPYATTLLFLFLMAKVLVLVKQLKSRQ